MTARHILLIDDDEDLREFLCEQLSLYEEFEISTQANAVKGMRAARSRHVDLLVIDAGLPDMDGREVAKILRKDGMKAPIIMLTRDDADPDTIMGLKAVANDYVTKPLRFAVLLARIRAQLRIYKQSDNAAFSIGHYIFRPVDRILAEWNGKVIRLTEKETAIVKYLYSAEKKTASRDELLKRVWKYNSGVTTHTLETHIYRLRQKIESDPSDAKLLVTEGGGYRLIP